MTGEQTNRISRRYFGELIYPLNVAFSRDGQRLVINSSSGLFVWDIPNGQILRSFGRYGLPAHISQDGHQILTSDPDIYASASGYPSSGGQNLVLLRVDSSEELIQWTLANRAVATLDCDQREYYGITPLCNAQGTPLTPTPYLSAIPTMLSNEQVAMTLTRSIEQTGTAIDLLFVKQPTITLTPSYTATATPLPPTATPTSNLTTQTAQGATEAAYSAATQTSSLLTATVVTYTPSMTPT